MRRLLAIVTALICACGTGTAAAGGADLIAKGIYRSKTSIENTTIIPAVLGIRFGVTFLVNASAGASFPLSTVTTVIWRFPAAGLRDPGSKLTSHVDTHEVRCTRESRCSTVWTFDHPWELVPGVWEVEILVDKRSALKQSFTVVAP
jgi:hypothetical protein